MEVNAKTVSRNGIDYFVILLQNLNEFFFKNLKFKLIVSAKTGMLYFRRKNGKISNLQSSYTITIKCLFQTALALRGQICFKTFIQLNKFLRII